MGSDRVEQSQSEGFIRSVVKPDEISLQLCGENKSRETTEGSGSTVKRGMP
jgi:hypothetical protein